MKKTLIFAMFGILALGAIIYLFYPRPQEPAVLRIYAGAGLRPAVEQLAAAFTTETGIQVEPDYGGSGLILSRAQNDKQADLFLPGDAWYVDRMQVLSSNVAQRRVIAWFLPVIIVARGNPKNVHGLADLTQPGLRVGLGKAEACQVGRVSVDLLKKAGLDPAALKAQESLTVNELGIWVKMKAVDAAIVWDATAAGISNDVQTVAIPRDQNIFSEVVLARLTTARHPAAADRFVAFVAGSQGRRILRGAGYQVEKP